VPQRDESDDPDLTAWREIVENYGDRAELPDDPDGPVDTVEQTLEPGTAYPLQFGEFGDDVDEPFEAADEPADEQGFVPVDPEPLHLGPVRTAAWAGVLGAPLVALLATVVVTATSLTVPHWFGWLLVAAFLGGFGYLVATMPKDRDDPWDDGARL
jgi:hypothetical protein